MKFDFIKTIISLGISFEIAFELVKLYEGDSWILLGIGSFIVLMVTLTTLVAVSFKLPGTTANVRAISGAFFAFAAISNIIFAWASFSVTSFVLVNGTVVTLFLICAYAVGRIKQ